MCARCRGSSTPSRAPARAKLEAESRREDDLAPVTCNGVGQAPVAKLDDDLVARVGRGEVEGGLGGERHWPERRGAEQTPAIGSRRGASVGRGERLRRSPAAASNQRVRHTSPAEGDGIYPATRPFVKWLSIDHGARDRRTVAQDVVARLIPPRETLRRDRHCQRCSVETSPKKPRIVHSPGVRRVCARLDSHVKVKDHLLALARPEQQHAAVFDARIESLQTAGRLGRETKRRRRAGIAGRREHKDHRLRRTDCALPR